MDVGSIGMSDLHEIEPKLANMPLVRSEKVHVANRSHSDNVVLSMALEMVYRNGDRQQSRPTP